MTTEGGVGGVTEDPNEPFCGSLGDFFRILNGMVASCTIELQD